MKTKTTTRVPISLFIVSFILCVSMVLPGCEGDQDTVVPDQYVEFLVSEQQMGEANGASTVKLRTGQPALRDGLLKIKITFDASGRFTSDPTISNEGFITLPIIKGQTDLAINIIPTNNDDVDGNEKLEFTLAEVSEGFVFGTKKKSEVTIFDDDVAIKANFLQNVASIRENKSEGLDMVVVFTGFTKSAGTVEVGFESSAIYGTDFTTEPAMNNGKVILPAAKDIDYVSLRIVPIDDNVVTGDVNITFKLLNATGGLAVGDQRTLDITLLDDENYPEVDIATVRSLYTGESMILDNMYLTAAVTSVDNTGVTTTFIEDETGGIAIRLLFINDFKRGDRLFLNLGYGLLKETAGVLEIQQVSEAQKIGTAQPSYDLMTLEELYDSMEDHEGTLVALQDVRFPDADGVKTMGGDRTVSDGIHTAVVRTLDRASFRNKIVPAGDLIVKGILTEVNGQYVLYPQVFEEDLVTNAGLNPN